jgi:uncharacterized protein (TIGR02996 family)
VSVEAFLEVIRESPEDDAPRLVFADWLEEHGQPERAEFIRLQCALARMGKSDKRREALKRRDAELLARHNEAWLGALPALAGPGWRWGFHRGLVHASRYADGTTEALAALEEALAVIAEAGEWAWVEGLSVSGMGWAGDAGGVQALAASPGLARLTYLDLGRNGIGAAGARALAASPHLARLTRLRLSSNQIGDAGVRALAASPGLARLTYLDLGRNGIGAAGACALAASPNLARLAVLVLTDNKVGNAGAAALAAAPHMARLTRLNLLGNGIRLEEAAALERRFAGWTC